MSSFYCDKCHYKDTSVTSAASLGPAHTTYSLKVDPMVHSEEDVLQSLSRTIIRSESARILIPELEFEIPPKRSEIITVEGMLLNIRESLIAGQEERRTNQPEIYEKLQNVIDSLEMMQEGRETFTMVIEDAAGNSFITNPEAPKADRFCTVVSRPRTREETIALGFSPDDPLAEQNASGEKIITKEEREALIAKAMKEIKRKEKKKANAPKGAVTPDLAPERGEGYKSGGAKAALKFMSQTALDKKDLEFDKLVEQNDLQSAVFNDTCYECGHANETRMCVIDIPYFHSTIIMCTDCQYCGYKNTEIKAGGGISEQGTRMEVRVTSPEDLSRDVLKSDFAAVFIPELDIEVSHGTLGGKFTTIEGLLLDIKEQLSRSEPYYTGDSAFAEQKAKYDALLKRFDGLFEVKENFTFVIYDPAGGSFIEGRVDGVPDTDPRLDSSMTITHYTRTDEQDDQLGIKDMVTEDYYIKEETEEDVEDSSDEESAEEHA